jgi:hypothetical protein
MKKIKVIYNFLNEEETILIKKCLEKLNKSGDTIRIEPFRRYGFSGAKILLVRFTQKGGIPFILKIHDKESIKRESIAIQEVKSYYIDTLNIQEPLFYSNYGVLIYNYFSSDGKLDSKTFEDVIYKEKVGEIKPLEIIDLLYSGNIKTAYSEYKKKKINWLRNYSWYLRNKKSIKTINIALNHKTTSESIELNGFKLFNPILFLKKFNFNEEIHVAPIHGDLHANNIVISDTKAAHLIDFAWAHKKHHVLIDFTLMECSLRYALLPKYLCTELVYKLDRQLSIISKPIECHSCPLNNENGLNRIYLCQCCKLVTSIRNHAKNTYKNDDIFNKHYSFSLYIMLFGLIQYPQYLKDRCIINLGFLSNEIANHFHNE